MAKKWVCPVHGDKDINVSLAAGTGRCMVIVGKPYYECGRCGRVPESEVGTRVAHGFSHLYHEKCGQRVHQHARSCGRKLVQVEA